MVGAGALRVWLRAVQPALADRVRVDEQVSGGDCPPGRNDVPQRLAFGVHQLVQTERSPWQSTHRRQRAGCSGLTFICGAYISRRFGAWQASWAVFSRLDRLQGNVADQCLLRLAEDRRIAVAVDRRECTGYRVQPRNQKP
jgi:hypothetical protein